MAGIALGRLWDTHPKLACVLHFLTGSLIGLVTMGFWLERSWGTAAVLTIGFVVDAAAFVTFTVDAAQHSWTRRVW